MGELGRQGRRRQAGAALTSAVPRERFIPDVVWVEDSAERFAALSRAQDPERWRALVAADEPVITQVDDGRTEPGEAGLQPSSSCSQPSVVARMLAELDVRPGHRVLEIGTGTGWNAALLAHAAGPAGEVVSIEVDEAVAAQARRALRAAGCAVAVRTGDGAVGHAPRAPYDRVIATAAVREIPPAWLEQAAPGAVLVVPWGTDYCNGTLLRLEKRSGGTAAGRCGPHFRFMRMRGQRRHFLEPSAAQFRAAERGCTGCTAGELFEMVEFSRAAFTIGLRVPDCYCTVEDPGPDERRIELHDIRSGSWARVTMLRGRGSWPVHQLGPRRLWDEVQEAHRWWAAVGRPRPEQYELIIGPGGEHRVRLGEGISWRVGERIG